MITGLVMVAFGACAERSIHVEPAGATGLYYGADPDTGRRLLLDFEHLGDVGPVDPIAIEVMLASPASPIVAWFAVALGSDLHAPHDEGADFAFARARRALELLASEARAIADPPDARAYARAYARRIAPALSTALATSGGGTYPGVVRIECCGTVDPELLRLEPFGEIQAELDVTVVRNAAARMLRITWNDRLRRGDLAWDASGVRGVFTGGAHASYDDLALALVPLHAEVTR